jgi:Ca2+-binding RTX toxin-like protein
MAGFGGDDILTGSEDLDFLYGGDGNGNDTLNSGLGPDTVDGGNGVDGGARTVGVNVSLDGVANDGQAGEGDNVNATVEHVTGGGGPDTLTGSAAANYFYGGDGNDTLTGGDGNDNLQGGHGTTT